MRPAEPYPLAMIIEDDDKLSLIFIQALKMAGFEVTHIDNGRKAVEALQTTVPTLILLDLHLPEVPGEQLLARIRQDPRLARVIVVITTADPITANVLDEQTDFILQKPISFGQLRDLAVRIRGML
ncbi:MAG: response regulator [Anaerolineales bacterium]|nr:response regulator [Anaerolineales bacterium]